MTIQILVRLSELIPIKIRTKTRRHLTNCQHLTWKIWSGIQLSGSMTMQPFSSTKRKSLINEKTRKMAVKTRKMSLRLIRLLGQEGERTRFIRSSQSWNSLQCLTGNLSINKAFENGSTSWSRCWWESLMSRRSTNCKSDREASEKRLLS